MSSLPEKTGTFTGSEGVRIFYRHFPAETEKARLVIAHGLGEHSGRYGNVIERLLPKAKANLNLTVPKSNNLATKQFLLPVYP